MDESPLNTSSLFRHGAGSNRRHFDEIAAGELNQMGSECLVVTVIAGQHDHLETPRRSEVEHLLDRAGADGIGIYEGVVEHDWQAAVVVGGQNLRHGQPQRGRDLLPSASAEALEAKPGTPE